MKHLFARVRFLFDKKKNSEPGLFVHIPKTSGMSFVDALAENESVIHAYGLKAPITSDEALENIYKRYRPYDLFRTTDGAPVWLAGHFRLAKRAELVDCRRIITFVRDPIERVISQFNHARSYMVRDADIDSFIDHPKNQNMQSKYLEGIPRECIGFVGVTEKNDESLEIINHELALHLTQKYSNRNTTKTIARERVSEELCARITERNMRDVELYDWALETHKNRYQFLKEDKQWCHGFYTVKRNNLLYGVAFFASNDEPVKVSILLSGVHIQTLTANLPYREPLVTVFPRKRRVAFKMRISEPACDYQVVVTETGQRLNFQPSIQ